jgi:hypothetical protein
MVKKLESIWDCSRMMLPEHKIRIISDERAQSLRSKPVLDSQEWELIDHLFSYSKRYNERITITLFDPGQDINVRGVVLAVDRQLRQIKFKMENDYNWIKIDNVIRVTT